MKEPIRYLENAKELLSRSPIVGEKGDSLIYSFLNFNTTRDYAYTPGGAY